MPHTRSSVVRLHQLVRLDHLSEPFNARCIRPWLSLTLLPHHTSEATRPALSWKSLDDTLNRSLSNHLAVQTRVVKNSGEVDNRRERADHSRVAQVLVPDDCFAHGFCLRDFCVVRFEQFEGYVAASEFEGKVCGSVVFGRGSDVVQQSRKQESLRAALPGGEMLGRDSSPCRFRVSRSREDGAFNLKIYQSSTLSWSDCTSALVGSVWRMPGCELREGCLADRFHRLRQAWEWL